MISFETDYLLGRAARPIEAEDTAEYTLTVRGIFINELTGPTLLIEDTDTGRLKMMTFNEVVLEP